jgi:serine/threonine-protein kinase
MTVSPEQASEQLQRILAGSTFQAASRSRELLQFLVQETLAGRSARIKEYVIGVEALGRPEQFDPRTDPIVRAEASRLRTKLDTYYAGEGKADPVVIQVPRGTYVPEIRIQNESVSTLSGSTRRLKLGSWVWALAALLTLTGFIVGSRFASSRVRQQPTPIFLDVELHTNGTVASQVGPDFAISLDGTQFVFIAMSPDGTPRLHLRRMDRMETTLLPGTEGVRVPFFSPDGNAVAFWASGKLKKIMLGGGSPVVLCDATDLLGGTWSKDGFIFAVIERQKLSKIPAAGGPPEVVLDLSTEGRTPAWPQVVTDSRNIVYTSLGFEGADRSSVEVLDLDTKVRRKLVVGATFGRVLDDSWLLYVNQSMIFVQPLKDLKRTGEPLATKLRVPYSSTFGYAQYDIAATGTLIYRRTSGLTQPHWLTSDGKASAPLMPPAQYAFPSVSPDGTRFAVALTESGMSSVLIRTASGSLVTRIPSPAQAPVWSPDGSFIVLGSLPNLGWSAATQGVLQSLTASSTVQSPWSFSPDGKVLAYGEFDKNSGFDLWTIPLMRAGARLSVGKPSIYLKTSAFETYPSFSPDGRWMAYASNESGTWQVYIRAYPDNGTKVQVTSTGGRISRWSRSTSELLYRTDDHRLMIASLRTNTGKMTVSAIRTFHARRLADTGVLANFDLAPDGRVLALLPTDSTDEEQSPNHLSLVLDLPAHLSRLTNR